MEQNVNLTPEQIAAIDVLSQGVVIAQSRGVYTLEDASLLQQSRVVLSDFIAAFHQQAPVEDVQPSEENTQEMQEENKE